MWLFHCCSWRSDGYQLRVVCGIRYVAISSCWGIHSSLTQFGAFSLSQLVPKKKKSISRRSLTNDASEFTFLRFIIVFSGCSVHEVTWSKRQYQYNRLPESFVMAAFVCHVSRTPGVYLKKIYAHGHLICEMSISSKFPRDSPGMNVYCDYDIIHTLQQRREDLLLWRRIEVACFCALLPTFRFSFCFSFFAYFLFPSSRYVYLPRVPSSVQQPYATLSKYVFCSTCSFCLCHLYPTPSRNSFVFSFV